MKKLVLAALAMGLGASVFAQGTINFANSSSSYVITNTIASGGASGRAASALGTRVQLYYGSVGSTEAQLVAVGTPASMTIAGVFSGGSLTLPGIAEGANAVFEVRGWTGAYASYDAAYAAAIGGANVLVGISQMWTQGTGAPNGAPPTVVGMVNGAGGFGGLTLSPVPEPSTIALAGLGAASLLLFRRRK